MSLDKKKKKCVLDMVMNLCIVLGLVDGECTSDADCFDAVSGSTCVAGSCTCSADQPCVTKRKSHQHQIVINLKVFLNH